MKLYEIKSKYDALFELYNNTEDEAEREEILTQLSNAEESLDAKLESCCRYLRNLEANIDSIETELKRLKARQVSLEKASRRLKNYVGHNLGFDKTWRNDLFTLSWRRSESVSVDNERMVPAAYIRESLSYSIDKDLAKEKLKSGEIIPGLSLLVKKNLQLK